MKLTIAAIGVACLASVSLSASAGEYDFDWKDRNHMRGAWTMCATTGFTEGDCPKVFQKCWQPPMIYRKRHKTRTYCKDDPDFFMGQEDTDRALGEANKKVEEGFEPPL